MSEQASETVDESGGGAEPPAGFPGAEPVPLDVEADAESRALAVLTQSQESAEAEGDPPPAPEAEVPEEESAAVPPAEAPSEAPGEPQVSEALATALALKQELEKERVDIAREREEAKAIHAQRDELEPLIRARKMAQESNFFGAIQEMFPGAKPDDVIKAIAEGRGLDRPEDRIAAFERRIEEKAQEQVNRIEELNRQRDDAEVEHTLATAVGRLPDEAGPDAQVSWSPDAVEAAPLVAAFGQQGLALVRQSVNTERANGSRVTRESVRKALDQVESELVQNFLTVALKSEAVRTKYAEEFRPILPGISDRPPRVPSGHSLSNRATSDSSRRASTEDLTEEQREANALRLLRGG